MVGRRMEQMRTAARAVLVLPADKPRLLAKARTLRVDEIVLDLQDAVAGAERERERARAGLEDAVCALTQSRRVAVRVNGVHTPWARHDLAAVSAARRPPHSVVVSRVETADDLRFCRAHLGDGIALQASIETAPGLRNLAAICAQDVGLESIVLDSADLARSLGRDARAIDAPERWSAIQDQVVVVAQANGLAAIDGPCLRLGSREILRASSRAARRRGFDAKWAIHPSQLDVITDIFAPDACCEPQQASGPRCIRP